MRGEEGSWYNILCFHPSSSLTIFFFVVLIPHGLKNYFLPCPSSVPPPPPGGVLARCKREEGWLCFSGSKVSVCLRKDLSTTPPTAATIPVGTREAVAVHTEGTAAVAEFKEQLRAVTVTFSSTRRNSSHLEKQQDW